MWVRSRPWWYLLVFGLVGGLGSGSLPERPSVLAGQPFTYEVGFSADQAHFEVRLELSGLTRESNLFQFAATAPGTYQVMDIGRFVSEFRVFDKRGQRLEWLQMSCNSFRLTQPERVARIEYRIAETWDTPVAVNEIYPMAGTTLAADHALINGQAVFGYVAGRQDQPIRVVLHPPKAWQVGTALTRAADGSFQAKNYDQLADSPILMGRLSSAVKQLANCEVRVFVYSKTDLAQAEAVLGKLEGVVGATGAFLAGFPVNQYTFLYHFDEFSAGGWEHAYSSFYVASEHELDQVMDGFIARTAAHEMFHMVTPLHIHSDRLSPFNFQKPEPSGHIWFYEGVTEWASGVMSLRSGLLDLNEYLALLQKKLIYNDGMDPNFSLEQVGLLSYTEKGQWEWPNIYSRGAVVACLMDILLLDRSEGRSGLRELILELAQEYGPERAFSETGFFDMLVARTHPDLAPFIERYIKQAQPLPIAEVFQTIGIEYQAELPQADLVPDPGLCFRISSDRKVLLAWVSAFQAEHGFRAMDEVVAINGRRIDGASLGVLERQLQRLPAGASFKVMIMRQRQQLDLETTVGTVTAKRHQFQVLAHPTARQQRLRDLWSRNLPFVRADYP